MDLTPLQQATELLNRSKSILICLPASPSSDAIASGLGLFLTIEKLRKRSRIVCSKFELPSNHSFLPKSEAIEKELKNLRQFIISLDVSRVAVEELSYDFEDKKLNIFITPKNGYYETRDITTSAGNYAYDAAVIIDSPDLEALGDLSSENAEFFYRTPVLNIDHSPKNTYFGTVNLVDLTATSVSEIVFELVKALGFNVLDEQVATTLLTGIISKTKSFQSATVTPRSLAIASHLIAAGARREEIIDNLFQSKAIATLKLWGRALARLQEKYDGRLIWSIIGEQDFSKSGATEEDLTRVIDELIINIPTAEVIILISTRGGNNFTAHAIALKPVDLKKIFLKGKDSGPGKPFVWKFSAENVEAAESMVLRAAAAHFERT